MADDGKGPRVKSPTVMVCHDVGVLITEAIISQKKTVSVVVTFETYKKSKAQVMIWMSSLNRKSYVFIRELEPYIARIMGSGTF
jgi:hypothetical protein